MVSLQLGGRLILNAGPQFLPRSENYSIAIIVTWPRVLGGELNTGCDRLGVVMAVIGKLGKSAMVAACEACWIPDPHPLPQGGL